MIWDRLGEVVNYVEPFAGSLAVLLARPTPIHGSESVNDLNGWLVNVWRSIAFDPEMTAEVADWPVSEMDLHSRGDALFYRMPEVRELCDALHISARCPFAGECPCVRGVEVFTEWMRRKSVHRCIVAGGVWVWGQNSWIGSGWGPVNGNAAGTALRRMLPHLGDAGRGVNRQLPHLGTAGQGVHRKRPHLGDAGNGVNQGSPADRREWMTDWFQALAGRLRDVRRCCGDWRRVCGPSVTFKHGLTGIFLDPPYSHADRKNDLYANDSMTVALDVGAWCRANGDNPLLRIALSGYAGEHDLPGWDCVQWKAHGGHGNQRKKKDNENNALERIWFSPYCNPATQRDLFSGEEALETDE